MKSETPVMKNKKKKKKRDKKHKKDRDKSSKVFPQKVAVKSGSKYKALSWVCFGLSGACVVIAVFTFASQGQPPEQGKLEVKTTTSVTSTTSTTTSTSTSTTSTTTSTTTLAPRCCSKVWFRGDIYTVETWNDAVWSTDKKPIKYLSRTNLGSWVQSHFIDGSRPFLQTNPNFAECPTDETQWFYCYCVQRSCDCSNDFARFEIINKYPICA